jgi:hypothetical protein
VQQRDREREIAGNRRLSGNQGDQLLMNVVVAGSKFRRVGERLVGLLGAAGGDG